MLRRFHTNLSITLTALLLAGLSNVACEVVDDAPIRLCDNCPTETVPVVPSFAEPEGVLEFLEVYYDDREALKFGTLLDSAFTFYFDPSDVNDPSTPTPQQWGSAEEIRAVSHMFYGYPNDDGFAIVDVDVDLALANLNWVDTVPPDFPDEVWKSATVSYSFVIAATHDLTYISVAGAKAEFTVRRQTDGTWRLVEWRDMVASSRNAPIAEKSWGRVKHLFVGTQAAEREQ